MLSGYRTILAPSEAEITEKKSRFIAWAVPVEDEAAALSELGKIRKQHSLASHHCYAYRLIAGQSVSERYSDDGEPNQTAGLPMLGVLAGMELYNVLAVVARYFGGTLLGTGGLVRAYSAAVKKALTNGALIDKKLYIELRILCDYSYHGKIVHELANLGVFINETTFDAEVELLIYAEKGFEGKIASVITDITNGRSRALIGAEAFGYAHNNKIIVDSFLNQN